MKNIKQIQHEVAKEAKFANWDLFIRSERYKPSLIENKWTLVCERFANQFQAPSDTLLTEIMVLREKNAELTSLLSKIVKGYNEAGGEMWIPDHIGNYITQAESLISSNSTE